jgi:hypothetical protein
MDIGIIAAIALLVLWAIGTFALGAPGWIHLFLTLGVTMLIWRIVARSTPAETSRRP